MKFSTVVGLVAVLTGVIFVVFKDDNSFRLTSISNKSRGLLDIVFSKHAQENYGKTIESYDKKFESDETKDPSMVNDYYTIATDFYEYGWGQSFHFAGREHNETFLESIARHEHILADAIGLKKGLTALDCGSGVGGPARSIAKHSEGEVVGITINEYQIGRSRQHTKDEGLEEQVTFVQGDFTKMPFEDNTYDAAYAIEATCHAPKLTDVYGQIFRVLKPGALFGTYEWITTLNYDASDESHKKAVFDIEYGNGLPPLRSEADVLAAAKEVGFEIVYNHDLVHDEKDTDYPWYNRMDMNYFSYYMTHITCFVTETLGFAPKGTVDTHWMLMHALDGLVAGGKKKIFTPMHLFVFRKPEAKAPVHVEPVVEAVVEAVEAVEPVVAASEPVAAEPVAAATPQE